MIRNIPLSVTVSGEIEKGIYESFIKLATGTGLIKCD